MTNELQIQCQEDIIRETKASITDGLNYCKRCLEHDLCRGCRLHYMIIDMQAFVEKY